MDFNINEEMQQAIALLEKTKEAYNKAQGRVDYLQSIIIKMNEEANNIHKENHNGVIAQSDFDLSASSS